MIISFLNQKGGVGKTTLAFNFAVALAKKEIDVLAIDSDIQGSFISLYSDRENKNFECKQIINEGIGESLKKQSQKNHKMVIVDVGGKDDIIFRNMILNSDFIVLPIVPSIIDLKSLFNVIDIVKEAREIGYSPKIIIAINMVNKGELIEQFTLAGLKSIKEYAIIMSSKISNRVAYRYSLALGKGVVEYNDKKAIEEFDSFYNELMRIIEKGE